MESAEEGNYRAELERIGFSDITVYRGSFYRKECLVMKAIQKKQLNENVQVKIFTKLMERLDVADAENLTELKKVSVSLSEVSAISDSDGCDVVFANNPGQGGVCYYFGRVIEGQNGSVIPLYGKNLVGGVDAGGAARAYVIADNSVYTSYETSPHSGKFCKQEPLEVTLPYGFRRITALRTLTLEEGFALFAVSETWDGAVFITCRMSGERYDYMLPYAFGEGSFCFSGKRAEDRKIHQASVVDGKSFYTCYSFEEDRLERFVIPLKAGETVTDITAFGDMVFCVSSEQNMYQMFPGEGGITLETVGYVGTAAGITMQQDGNALHVACVDEHKRLQHCYIQKPGSEYSCSNPFPLDEDTSAACFCGYGNTAVLYYFSIAAGCLVRLGYDAESDNWNETQLAVPEPDTILQLPCYSTEITLMDAKLKIPLVQMPVLVWTEQRTYLEAGGRMQMCDSEHKLNLTTDECGRILVAQYTNKIDVPVIYASLPEDYMSNDECMAIMQSETVSDKLGKVSADELLKAKKTDSLKGDAGYLLSDEYRNTENANAITASIEQVMALVKLCSRDPYGKGAYLVRKEEIGTLKQISVSDVDMPAWMLSAEGNRLVYANLTDSEYALRVQEIKKDSLYLDAAGFNGLFSSIGDFFRGVVKKIVSVVKVIVKGITTVVQFVLDGVKLVYEFVSRTIGEILDFVETIFAIVAVFFVGIFAWIAALFMWDDVKRTQRALKGVLNGFLDAASKNAGKLQAAVGTYLRNLDANLDSTIDELCQTLLPGQPLMSYAHENTPENPEAEETISNDYLKEKCRSAMASVSGMALSEMNGEICDQLQDIWKEFEQVYANIGSSQEWKDTLQYLKEQFSSVESVFDGLMISILQIFKLILHLLLQEIVTPVETMLGVVQKLLNLFETVMNSKVKLPFFTSLYRLMTGDDLTAMNIVTFLLSVPVVLLAKLMGNGAPFTSEEAVDAFIEECIQCFFQETGQRPCRKKISGNGRFVLSYAAIVSGLCYNQISAMLDLETEYPVSKAPAIEILGAGGCREESENFSAVSFKDAACLILEFAWLIFGVPWLYETDEEEVKESDIALFCTFCVGCLIDSLALLTTGIHIDRRGIIGRSVTSLYGLTHLTVAAIYTDKDKLSASKCVPEFCGAAAEMTKLGIDAALKFESMEWCRYLVVGLDITTALAVLCCGLCDLGGE